MDDARLEALTVAANTAEREIREHLLVELGAFEQARGLAAYRGAVALRTALEQWKATRAQRSRQE